MHIILGIVLLLGVVVLPGWWVQRVMKRYSQPADRYPGTGGQLARHLLDRSGLESVAVVRPDEHRRGTEDGDRKARSRGVLESPGRGDRQQTRGYRGNAT